MTCRERLAKAHKARIRREVATAIWAQMVIVEGRFFSPDEAWEAADDLLQARGRRNSGAQGSNGSGSSEGLATF